MSNNALPLLGLLLLSMAVQASPEPEPARQKALVRMVRQDCGSCHGMTLQGGLGPALLPANLKDQSNDGLAATIYFGRATTPMPPWRDFLSEAEAEWIVKKLKEGFPQ